MTTRSGPQGWLLSSPQRSAAMVSGLVAALASTAPTGGERTDLVVRTVLTGLAARAGWRAPAWSVVVAAGGLAAFSLGHWIAALFGAIAVTITVVELRGRLTATARGVTSCVVLVAAHCLPSGGAFGVSTAAGLAAAGLLVISGLANEERTVRRRYVFGTVFAAELAALCGGLAAYRLVRIRDDVEALRPVIREAIDAATADDQSATDVLERARQQTQHLADQLDSPLVRSAEWVPLLAQHVRTPRVLAARAADAMEAAADAIDEVSFDRLAVTDGQVDLATIESMATVATRTAASFTALDDAVRTSDSGWLVGPAHDAVREIGEDTARAAELSTDLSGVLRAAPGLLGGDGERRYLVAFINPAEARGLGGFLGNYALLTADDGRVTMSDFGRSDDFMAATAARGEVGIQEPAAYLERYAHYGVGGGSEPTPEWWWQQITVSPDMPSAAQAIADFYEGSTGTALDGVMAIAPQGIAAAMAATGPVEVPSIDRTITADSVSQFVMYDQYLLIAAQPPTLRTDALELIARTTFDRLLDLGSLTRDTLRPMGDAVARRHVMVWAADVGEQDALSAAGIGGEFSSPRGSASAAVALMNQNGGPNKLDAYLQRSISYDAVVDDRTGTFTATTTVLLENQVPSLDFEPQVVGNAKDEPNGTNRTTVSFYSDTPIETATIDGAPSAPLSISTELGWHFYEQLVRVPYRGSTTLTFTSRGVVDPDEPFSLLVHPQVVALPDHVVVDVRSTDGRTLLAFDGTVDRTTVLEPAAG